MQKRKKSQKHTPSIYKHNTHSCISHTCKSRMLRLAGSVSVGTTSDLDYHIRNSREDDHDDDDDKHAVRGSAEGKERERERAKKQTNTNITGQNKRHSSALLTSLSHVKRFTVQSCKTAGWNGRSNVSLHMCAWEWAPAVTCWAPLAQRDSCKTLSNRNGKWKNANPIVSAYYTCLFFIR